MLLMIVLIKNWLLCNREYKTKAGFRLDEDSNNCRGELLSVSSAGLKHAQFSLPWERMASRDESRASDAEIHLQWESAIYWPLNSSFATCVQWCIELQNIKFHVPFQFIAHAAFAYITNRTFAYLWKTFRFNKESCLTV